MCIRDRYWINNGFTKNCIIAGAYLHDTLEDQPQHKEKLFDFPELTKKTILGMTKDTGVNYSDYILNMKSPSVIAVKLADLTFNIKESESRELNSYEKQRLEKYRLAKAVLMIRVRGY